MHVICVTNRKLCADFYTQLEKVCISGADRIILREKDMNEAEYEQLAAKAAELCERYSVPLTLHTFADTASKLGIKSIHFPLPLFLEKAASGELDSFSEKGTSVHSVSEATAAQNAGADYLIAGHIFATDCKKDLEPRGTDFLADVCRAVSIPVYAIGGISPENASFIKNTGAAGVCVMSSLMMTDKPDVLVNRLK